MIFLGGPRQCGKTTLANSFLQMYPGEYFNWDAALHRKKILAQNWTDKEELLIFDEIHKYPRWKNWVKGIYDTEKDRHKIFVTGSARLDVYKKGGDSLLGRYHYWRLHPFTLTEVPAGITRKDAFDRLMTVGGFPEPFLENDPREANRWRTERISKISVKMFAT